MSEYDVPRTGGLKLKKIDHTIKKKKKKTAEEPARNLEAPSSSSSNNNYNSLRQDEGQEEIDAALTLKDIEAKMRQRNPLLNKTKAELKTLQMQEKMKEKRILEKASKTHKMRVEDFNKHLDNLTEHFDIPKVSWTK